METFGISGFVFGMMGVVAFTEVTKLKKDVEAIKKAVQ